MAKSNKKRASHPPAQPAASRQCCSICQSIPERCAAFWKGGELRGKDLPAAASRLSIVGAPFMDDDTGSSNACLKQCPECGAYYDWRFTYEYLVNGSEDEIVLTRISQAAGQEWAQRIAQAIEAYQAQFAAAAPQHIDALLHAPRHPDRIQQAATFFWQGQRKGCEIAFALPALIHALARISRKRDAAITLKLALADFGAQSRQNLALVREQLQASGASHDPDIESFLAGCEALLRANCRVCKNLPEYASALMISEELPAASQELISLGPHFKQCPICGAGYFWECDTFPFVSGASDEERLYRLQPDQVELLQPLYEALPGCAAEMAFYVGELLGRNWLKPVEQVALALLCAFADTNEPVHALAYRCLERFVAARPARARAVLDLIHQHAQHPPTPRAWLNLERPEFAKLVAQCKQIATSDSGD